MTSKAGRPAVPGELIIVATPIGNMGDLSSRAAAVLGDADVVCCEDTRHTGQMLARLGVRAKHLVSVHSHNEKERVAEVLELLERGRRVALVSDAGTPTVSDPGEQVIQAAIAAGYRVTSVPGPSAAVTALVVAGLGTSRWRFEGFLPKRGSARTDRLSEIAAARYPSVIYESPRRLAATLDDLATCCGGDRKVAVCRELTKLFEETWRGTLAEARDRAVAAPARGEHVLVVGGDAGATAVPSDEEIASAVASRMSAGSSRRQAATDVAAVLGVSKHVAYETSLAHGGR